MQFKGTSSLPSSSLSDVLAATLGYSVNQEVSWDGLYVKDPFHLASSVVAVVVEGAESLSFKVRCDMLNFDALNNQQSRDL